ncbi:MAG: hypothetical protein GX430_08130 [Treponema sp.]|nr:hypothetical protein [Treponema sp.]
MSDFLWAFSWVTESLLWRDCNGHIYDMTIIAIYHGYPDLSTKTLPAYKKEVFEINTG